MTSFPGCSAFSLTADLFRSHFCWPRLLTAQLCATFVPPSGDNLFNNLVAHLVGTTATAAPTLLIGALPAAHRPPWPARRPSAPFPIQTGPIDQMPRRVGQRLRVARHIRVAVESGIFP